MDDVYGMNDHGLLEIYRTMVLIREFELRTAALYESAEILGFVHLYAGEEAIAAGVCANLTDSDYMTSTHRGHGHLIAKGGKIDLMMAELFGKATGYCRGKGGSMHICDPDLGILGSNGIVGAGFPIATGAGLAAKFYGKGAVAVCFSGDAATNRGTFHESLNLASAWELPVLYVCENNLYGISVCARDAMNIDNIADRGAAYGIKSMIVDGNDAEAVANETSTALRYIRGGGGPVLMECKTWRQRGHFEGDPDFVNNFTYRNKEENDHWLARDPIHLLRERILNMKIAETENLETINKEVLDEIEKAVAFARHSPEPDKEEMLRDVYSCKSACSCETKPGPILCTREKDKHEGEK
jgi:pyruvate dehydrogenase E1 component alpha subunit